MTPARTVDHRATGDGLAEALDRAMELGLWEHAARIAKTATRLAETCPAVAERLVRLRLVEGRPDAALGLANRCREHSDELRLLKAVAHVHLGLRDHAHSDLLRWTRTSGAPSAARRMLALLDWESGDRHAATLALLRDLKRRDETRTLELLLLLATTQRRREQAATWAGRLRRVNARGADTPWGPLLRCSLQIDDEHRATVAPDEVTSLADELLDAETVIPSLVEAQRRRTQPAVAELLYRAIERALPALRQPTTAIEALARLAHVRGDAAAARAWMQRARTRNPMSVTLAAIERDIDAPLAPAASTPDRDHDRPDVLARIGRDDRHEQEKAA
ncbi:MAG: hypothetical protein ACYTGP_11355 [Planctomycetota bacterium]